MENNDRHWSGIKVRSNDSDCELLIENGTTPYTLHFGHGKWKQGPSSEPGPSLVAKAKNYFNGLPNPKTAGVFRWTNPNTLTLDLRYIESPHTEKITLQFEGENLVMTIENSFEKNNKTIIKGKVKP